jgi:hypothetical protein
MRLSSQNRLKTRANTGALEKDFQALVDTDFRAFTASTRGIQWPCV